jgi:hypothetical protein
MHPGLSLPGAHLYQLFRPEFMSTYENALNSDTYSQFIDLKEQSVSVKEVSHSSERPKENVLLIKIRHDLNLSMYLVGQASWGAAFAAH